MNRYLDIPAGESHYVVKASVTVPQDAELWGITPHAHYLATEMKVNARLPDGSVTPLIWIKDWDFNWQGQYRYKQPIKLPKGTKIELEYVYDNSAANPHNPSRPPVRVRFGEQTKDEMALAFLGLVLPSPADVQPFQRAVVLQYVEDFVRLTDNLNDLPEEIPPAMVGRLRLALGMFDRDGDGKLNAEERANLLKFIQTMMPQYAIASPKIVIAVALGQIQRQAEQLRELRGDQDLALGPVGDDAPVIDQHHAVDLRNQIGEMVRHHHQSDAGLRQLPEDEAQLVLGEEIQRRRRLIQNQCMGLVDQRAREQNAASFAGRHLVRETVRQMRDFEHRQRLFGFLMHLRSDFLMRPDADAREETGQRDIAAGDVASATGHQVARNDAEQLAQLENVPAVAAHDAHRRAFAHQRITFAGDGLDQRGFAAAVRPEDGDVLAESDPQRNVFQGNRLAAHDGDVLEFD